MFPRRNRSHLNVTSLEARDVPSGNQLFAVGDDGGGNVSVYKSAGPVADPQGGTAGSGELLTRFSPYAGLRLPIHVAVGDVTGDGVEDLVTAPGAGGGPHVKVFDGAALLQGQVSLVSEFFAYDARFAGGVFVATGQTDPGSPGLEIITGAGEGGGPHVRTFTLAGPGRPATPQIEFFAFDGGFRGGVRVAAGDVTGDGKAEVIAAAGPGGGPHVKIVDVLAPDPLALPTALFRTIDEFFAYDAGFRGGVYVAAGELDGDIRTAEVVAGAGAGGGPHLKVYGQSGSGVVLRAETFVGEPGITVGIRVGIGNLSQLAGRQSVYTGYGTGLFFPAVVTEYDPRLAGFTLDGGVLNKSRVRVPNAGDVNGVFVSV
jgi:hypothetical protein